MNNNFDVMITSLNVQGWSGAGSAEKKTRFEDRKPVMKKYLQGKNADFYAFQEMTRLNVEWLQKDVFLGMPYGAFGIDSFDGTVDREGQYVFYDSNKWEVVEKQKFWLSPTPEVSSSWSRIDAKQNALSKYATETVASPNVFNKGVCPIRFRNKNTGKTLWVISFHCSLYEPEKLWDRAWVMDLLKQFRAKGEPAILVGDFNAGKEELIGYQDTYVLDAEANAVDSFNHYGESHKMIDFFVSNFKSEYKVSIEPIIENGIYISDHFPITAEIVL